MRLLEVTNEVWGVDCLTASRKTIYIQAREQAINILHKDYDFDVCSIAEVFNKKTHATIINAIRGFEKNYARSKFYRDAYKEIRDKLGIKNKTDNNLLKELDLKNYIDKYFNLDISDKKSSKQYIYGRSLYFKVLVEHLGHYPSQVGRFLNKASFATMQSLKKFDMYYKESKTLRDCYHDIQVDLGLIEDVKKSDIKDLELSEPINKCIELLLYLTDEEVNDFIPRLEIYKKASAYNRKKKKEWERI